jgi:hypothetical protein
VIVHSFVHGLVASASIIGNRPRVGALVLVNGVLQPLLAVFLGHRLGLIGVTSAGLLAAAVTAIPGGIALLRPSTSLAARELFSELVNPWMIRSAPVIAVAGLVGVFYQTLGVWLSALAAALICLVYLLRMRPLYAALPLDARWTSWLVRLKVLPA